jgi:hypothetical protein
MKHNYIAFTFVALATTFQMYASHATAPARPVIAVAPKPVAPERPIPAVERIPPTTTNAIKAQEAQAAVAAKLAATKAPLTQNAPNARTPAAEAQSLTRASEKGIYPITSNIITRNVVSQINLNCGRKLTSKEQSNLALAIDGAKNRTYSSLQDLNNQLTSILKKFDTKGITLSDDSIVQTLLASVQKTLAETPRPTSADRSVTLDQMNNVHATEGAIGVYFEPLVNNINSNTFIGNDTFKGKITGISGITKTSSSSIAVSISQQLKKPLTLAEQSNLTQALDIARKPGGNWDYVNKVLDAILSQSKRPGERLTENNLLDALNKAQKTGTFTDIYNKTMSIFGSFFTPGPISKQKNLQSSQADILKYNNKVITFSDPMVKVITAETAQTLKTIALEEAINGGNKDIIAGANESLLQAKEIAEQSKADLAMVDTISTSDTNVGFEENPQPIDTRRRSITADPLATNPQQMHTPAPDTIISKAAITKEATTSESLDSRITFAPAKVRKPAASKTQEAAIAEAAANKLTAQSYNTQNQKTVEQPGFIV